MAPERLTKAQVTQAESKVGISHPIIGALERHEARIRGMNGELAGIAGTPEEYPYVMRNSGFLVDAIQEAGEFSLEPLEIVAIWSKATEVFSRRYQRYALARIVATTYAVQGLQNPAWASFPGTFLEEGEMSPELTQDKEGLAHVNARLEVVGRNLDQLNFYTSGTNNSGVELGAELGARIRDGDLEAKRELDELVAYRNKHTTPVLKEISENFGNSLQLIHMEIEKALEAPDEPKNRVFELAQHGAEIAERENIRGHVMFGNNFYLLFYTMRLAPTVELDQLPRGAALSRLQQQNQGWTAFTEQNSDLLNEISAAMEDYIVSADVLGYYKELLRQKKWDEAEDFDKSIHPELGGNAIDIAVWHRLNPLLERAAEAMRQSGITPEEYFS